MQSDKLVNAADKPAAQASKKSPKKATKPASKAAPKKAAVKKTAKKEAKPAAKKAAAKSTKTAARIKIRFEILFSTRFGQSMLISGAHPALGAESIEQAPLMEYINDQKWAVELELDKASLTSGPVSYTYLVRDEDGAYALSAPYQLTIPAATSSLTIRDAWNAPGFIENVYSTDALQAFAQAVSPVKTSSRKKYSHRFIITAPPLEAGKAICLIGAAAAFGGWDPAKAILLTQEQSGKWSVDLSLKLSDTEADIDYKYGIYDLASGRLESFEAGDNRVLTPDPSGASLLVLQNGFIRTN